MNLFASVRAGVHESLKGNAAASGRPGYSRMLSGSGSAAIIVFISLLAGIACSAVLARWGEYPFRLFDADFVHPHVLVRDLVAGGNLFQWFNSPALYAFPDWIFATTALLPIPSRAASLISSILLLGAFALAGGGLVRVYAKGSSLASAIVFYGLAMMATAYLAGPSIRWLVNYSASLYIHTGASLILLLSIWIGRSILASPGKLPAILVLAALGAATTYSDSSYLPWFPAPLLAAACIVAAARRSWKTLMGPTVIATVNAFAYIAEINKPFPSHVARLFPVPPLTSLDGMLAVVREGLGAGDPVIIVYVFAAIASVVVLIRATVTTLKLRSVSEIAAQDLLLSLSALSVLLLPVVAGVIDHPSKLRYAMAFVYLAPVLGLRIALAFLPERHTGKVALCGGLSLALLVILLFPNLEKSFRTGQHAELIACLVRNGLTDGYADHDYAKGIIFLTNDRIHLAQIGPNAPNNFSNRWRTERMDGSPFKPTFVLTDKLSMEHLARFGTSGRTITCPESDVRVFSKGLPVYPGP